VWALSRSKRLLTLGDRGHNKIYNLMLTFGHSTYNYRFKRVNNCVLSVPWDWTIDTKIDRPILASATLMVIITNKFSASFWKDEVVLRIMVVRSRSVINSISNKHESRFGGVKKRVTQIISVNIISSRGTDINKLFINIMACNRGGPMGWS